MDNDFLEKIIFAEHNFPKLFSNVQYTDYGILFFNEKIKVSHDSNHTIINDYISYNYSQVIDKIVAFYESKVITPRIYSSLTYGQLAKLEKLFLEKNFVVEKYINNWLVHRSKCSINEPRTLIIERINNDYKIINMTKFYDNKWEFPLLKRKIENKDYHFFTGYENNIPVSIAAIQYIGDIGRIDDIETKTAYRRRGYSRQMIRHIVEYHQKNNDNKILYLWYNNPTAGKIYKEAGFIDLENNFESWTAYKK